MVRPKKPRRVCFAPEVVYFKPRAVPLSELEEVKLSVDEMEALRLCDLEGECQDGAANEMGVSQSTVGRNLKSAREKITEGLVQGKVVQIKEAG